MADLPARESANAGNAGAIGTTARSGSSVSAISDGVCDVDFVTRDRCHINEVEALKARQMAQLSVRMISEELVVALRKRAAANGRSAEAEHREILRTALLGEKSDFVAARAKALRQRLRLSVDRSETIRSDRDRDSTA